MTRPPETTGLLKPSATSCFQTTGGPSFGQVVNKPLSGEVESRLGPRNCGQSAPTAAREELQRNTEKQRKRNQGQWAMRLNPCIRNGGEERLKVEYTAPATSRPGAGSPRWCPLPRCHGVRITAAPQTLARSPPLRYTPSRLAH